MLRKILLFPFLPLRWVIRFGQGGRTSGEKLLRRSWLAFIALLTVGVPLVWLFLFAQFQLTEPCGEFNWVQKINAETSRIPEADRAWPVYRKALGKLYVQLGPKRKLAVLHSGRVYTADRGLIISTIDRDRDLNSFNSLMKQEILAGYKQFAADNREVLDDILAATKLPHVGYLFDAAWESQLDKSAWLSSPRPACHMEMEVIRESLRRAFYAAAADGDSPRAMACVAGISRLCEHHSQLGPFLFAAPGANSGHVELSKDVSFAIQAWPDLFSDSELERLATMFESANGFNTDNSGVLDWIENLVDQCYSDDGRFTASGVEILRTRMFRNPDLPGGDQHEIWLAPLPNRIQERLTSAVVMPVAVRWLPSRETLRASLLEANKSRLELGALSILEVDRLNREAQFKRSTTKPAWRDRPLSYLASNFGWNIAYGPLQMRLKVTAVWIRLVQFRRENARWPDSLSELSIDVPLDCYAAQPVQYELRDGKPHIWSTGDDAHDNGGILCPTDRSGFDWQLVPVEDFDPDKHLRTSHQR